MPKSMQKPMPPRGKPQPKAAAAPAPEEPEEQDEPSQPEPGGDGEEGSAESAEQLAPEEKAQAEKVLDLVSQALYENEKVTRNVVGLLKQQPQDKAVADIVVALMDRAVQQAGPIPPNAVAGVVLKVMELVLDLGIEAQVLPQDQKFIDAAVESVAKAAMQKHGIKAPQQPASAPTPAATAPPQGGAQAPAQPPQGGFQQQLAATGGANG